MPRPRSLRHSLEHLHGDCVLRRLSIEERAQRRYREMREKGYDVELAKLQEDIAARDKADSERAISPLVQAADAVLLDTTGLSIEQVVEKILGMCR